jgi:hypothetical protein
MGKRRPDQIPKWQIRIRSEEPYLIDNEETLDGWTMEDIYQRLYITIHRTSYMVNQPNRWVWWAVDRWSYKKGGWVNLINGKSRLHADAKPR